MGFWMGSACHKALFYFALHYFNMSQLHISLYFHRVARLLSLIAWSFLHSSNIIAWTGGWPAVIGTSGVYETTDHGYVALELVT